MSNATSNVIDPGADAPLSAEQRRQALLEAGFDDPDPEQIQVAGGGGQAWRPANGMWVRGQRNDDNTYNETRKHLTGRLMRLGIHRGTTKEGQDYLQFEVDLLDHHRETVHIKAGLNDQDAPGIVLKPSVGACNLAWCVTQVKLGDLIRLEPVLGKEAVLLANGRKGGKPTYVNLYRIEGTTAVPVYRPKRDKDAPKTSLVEEWTQNLEPAIRAHEAYAERAADPDEATHYSLLCEECAQRGYPTPAEQPAAWLALMQSSFPQAQALTLSAYSDDYWGSMRQALQQVPAGQAPKQLKPYVKVAAAAPAAAVPAIDLGDYDPHSETE